MSKSRKRRRGRKRRSLSFPVAVLVVAVVALFAFISYKKAPEPSHTSETVLASVIKTPKPTSSSTLIHRPDSSASKAEESSKSKKTKTDKKRLYLIIDDAGHNITQLEKFLEFPGKINIAVLPGLKYSTQAAQLIYRRGKTVMLHQPMEALGGNDPGPNAIYTGMSRREVSKVLSDNLDSIPYVEGVNNHMGSAATEDERIMDSVLKVLKRRGLFFVDSLTHSGSVCSRVAERNGISIAKRNVFLDNDKSRKKIMEAIGRAKEYADLNGHAVMIGHVWSSELADCLIELYPEFIDEGYCFESASDFFILEQEGKN